MKIKKFVPFLFLAACAHTPPETIVNQHLIYCVTPEQYSQLKDAEPGTVHDQLTKDAQKDFVIVGNNAIALRIYADGLLKVIGGCIGPSPSDA